VIDVTDDGFVSLMLDSGDTRDDLKVPDSDVGKELKEKFSNDSNLLVCS
jgi:translation initiation factor 5A